MHIFFPVPINAKVFALGRGALSMTVDLACNEPEIIVPMVADGKDELGDVIGYLVLSKCVTQQPGLATYAVTAVRPPHDPPPNPATLTTLFQWPSLADYVGLLQSRSARHD